MNPKMYFIVGTRMTKTLSSAISMAAIRKCLIQLKGLLGNNSVVTDVRIYNKKVQRQGHCFFFFFLIEVQLIYNVVLDSRAQQSDSVIHIYIYIFFFLFQILFHYRLLQDTEYGSTCYIIGPCWLLILYTVICVF